MTKFYEQVNTWIHRSCLVRLTYVRQKKGRGAMYGRIIRFDAEESVLLLHNDDEKKVYSFTLNEIDQIEPSSTSIATKAT